MKDFIVPWVMTAVSVVFSRLKAKTVTRARPVFSVVVMKMELVFQPPTVRPAKRPQVAGPAEAVSRVFAEYLFCALYELRAAVPIEGEAGRFWKTVPCGARTSFERETVTSAPCGPLTMSSAT